MPAAVRQTAVGVAERVASDGGSVSVAVCTQGGCSRWQMPLTVRQAAVVQEKGWTTAVSAAERLAFDGGSVSVAMRTG